MGLRIFKLEEYDHTHEREQFRKLCSILKDLYDKSAEMHLLFANINFNGVYVFAVSVRYLMRLSRSSRIVIVVQLSHFLGSFVHIDSLIALRISFGIFHLYYHLRVVVEHHLTTRHHTCAYDCCKHHDHFNSLFHNFK